MHSSTADGPTVIRIGVLTPHEAVGPEDEFPVMAPGRVSTRVVRVSSSANADGGEAPTSSTDLAALTVPPFLDDAAESLLSGQVDVIGHASTTSGYAIGHDAELVMESRLSQLTGLPVAATCTSAVRALNALDVERVALIGAPWFAPELNQLGTDYFADRGFDVVSSQSAELSQDPRAIEAAAVIAWTADHVPDSAEAVFIGGNGFRAADAVAALEAVLDRPVLTSNQVLLWQLLACADETIEVEGHGQLFARGG